MKSQAVSIQAVLNDLTFLPDRTPESTPEQTARAFATLADYRDGGVFVGHYAGDSAWERHTKGDEIVMVIGGETTLFLLEDGRERAVKLTKDELYVVPQSTWHRFETPHAVKILTVTPQPTDHSSERPQA